MRTETLSAPSKQVESVLWHWRRPAFFGDICFPHSDSLDIQLATPYKQRPSSCESPLLYSIMLVLIFYLAMKNEHNNINIVFVKYLLCVGLIINGVDAYWFIFYKWSCCSVANSNESQVLWLNDQLVCYGPQHAYKGRRSKGWGRKTCRLGCCSHSMFLNVPRSLLNPFLSSSQCFLVSF